MNIGPYITAATNARNAFSGGQRAEEDSQLSKALLLHQIQQQDQQAKLAQALNQSTLDVNKARVGNFNSQVSDRSAKEDLDPVVRQQPLADGTMGTWRRSGKYERIDGYGNVLSAPHETAPTAAAAPQSDFSVSPSDTTDTLRGGLGLRPTPSLASALRQQPTPPQQAVSPKAPAPAFGKPAVAKAPPLADKLQARVAELVKQGMPLAKASDQARQEFGQMLQVPGTQSLTVLPGADGKPPQGVVTSTRDPSQLGKTVAIPDVTKAPPGGTGSAENTKKAEQLGLALNSAAEFIPKMEARKFASPNIGTGLALAGKEHGGIAGVFGSAALNTFDPSLSDVSGSMDLLMSAAAHSVGGARITPEQIKKFTSGYGLGTNDSPQLVQTKIRRAVDFLNAAAAVLPPDMVAKQHAALNQQQLAILQKYGYGQQPSAEALSRARQIQQETGGGESGASPQGSEDAAFDALIAKYKKP